MPGRTSETRVWWREYFDDVFFDLHQAFFDAETSRGEVSAMRELLALPVGARVLDAPCGWGRHTSLWAEAACVAFGVDLSVPLLRRAAQAGAGAGVPNRYAGADLRQLPFPDGSFDAVVNVFTSLGLLATDTEDRRVLEEARRVLRPGGQFLLETMHRDEVVCVFSPRDRWRLPDGTEVQVRRRFDPVTGLSHEHLRWRRGDRRGEKRHALRLRTATEIASLLAAAGFCQVRYLGGWDGRPFRHSSPRLIAIATP